MKRRIRPKRAGSALVLVLLAATLLMAMGVGTLSLGLRGRILAARDADQVEARCAADAGLSKALFEMNQTLAAGSWNGSLLPAGTDLTLPNCDATYSYATSGSLAGGYVLQSTGNANGSIKTVNAILRLQGLFEAAILTRGELILKAGTVVSGYNSGDSSITGVEAKIATTSTSADQMILNNGVVVNGPVFAGVDGDPDVVIKDLGATVDYQASITEEVTFPTITVPTLADMGTDIDVKGATLTIGPADSGKYQAITLRRTSQPAVLDIAGGDVVLHVTGDISMGQDCEIVVQPGASLTLYLDGDLVAANNSGFNNLTKIASSLTLYGTGTAPQTFDIKAKSDVFGVVYAPNADVDVYAAGDVYGSIVADSFEFKAGGNFYYDEALKDVSVDDDGVRFMVTRWSE
jgi:hypothetical protein